MTPQRYRQVGQIYHAALDLGNDRRAKFLDGVCGGDQELRREVSDQVEREVAESQCVVAVATT